MRNRDKILNNLHDLYIQRDHAQDMVELYGDRGDSEAMSCWEDALHAIQTTISRQRQALTKAGSYGTFANPANNYMEVWVWA